jgi:hypothetical protein
MSSIGVGSSAAIGLSVARSVSDRDNLAVTPVIHHHRKSLWESGGIVTRKLSRLTLAAVCITLRGD